MPGLFNRSARWSIDHPGIVLLIVSLLTGLATLGHVNPYLLLNLIRAEETASESDSAESHVSRNTSRPPRVEPISLTDADAVLVVHSPQDQFFTPEGTAALRDVVTSLQAADHVDSVLWMDDVPVLNIFGLQQPLLPRATASARQFAEARSRAQQHPLVAGQLLADDSRTLLMLIKIDWFFVESDDDCTVGLSRIAEAAASAHPDVDLTFQVTGHVPIYLTVIKTHNENQTKYQIIGYGMVLLMAVILFRGVRAVIIVALAPSMGVYWTLGLLRFFEVDNNPFNDIVMPILLSLVGLTDGVHLMVEIRRNSALGLTTREAVRISVQKVGLACGLTSLTTAIGLGSLYLAHHAVVREFGLCCVAGVLLTFVSVITVIPLASASWLGRRIHIGQEKGLIDRNLGRIGGIIDFVMRRPRMISAWAVISTLLFALISLQLRPDEKRSSSLPEHAEPAAALRHMDAAFGGLETASIRIGWDESVESDSAAVFEAIREVDEILKAEDLIGHPLSLRNFLEALPGDGEPAERMSMVALLPPPLKRAYYTPESRRASVSFRVRDLGIARYGPVFERIDARLSELHNRRPEFEFELSGPAVSRWRNLYRIVIDLAASLGSASVIIFVVLTCVFRSIRIGLISIVPNLFPLAVTASFLVFTGQSLEVVSVCAFTVCLGIAVDDTIHFLTRYQEELTDGESELVAIRRAFTGTGTALIMTTVVLVIGFSTVLFSDMRDQRMFAAMGMMTIASALFGDLVFLPALLVRYGRRQRSGGTVQTAEVQPAVAVGDPNRDHSK